LMSRRDFF